MDQKRWNMDEMSATIEAVMSMEGLTDKERHDLMRGIEHARVGRGSFQKN